MGEEKIKIMMFSNKNILKLLKKIIIKKRNNRKKTRKLKRNHKIFLLKKIERYFILYFNI
jgi:hypothetical protein